MRITTSTTTTSTYNGYTTDYIPAKLLRCAGCGYIFFFYSDKNQFCKKCTKKGKQLNLFEGL